MSGYKNFAIAGVGNIGSVIADEFLKAKAARTVDKVIILSRPDSVSKVEEVYASRGATVVPIADYTNVPAVSEALKGTDVIITTLGYAAQPLQVPIAEAAKTAGVRLFVPSEFGTSDVGAKDGALAMKAQLAEKIRSIIPVAQFFTGNFADWMWLPDLFLDPKSGKVAVGGDGNAKMSFTSRPDIARFVVHVLTALAPEESLNKAFRIEAERLSFNEIFKAYEEKHGTKLEVKYIPLEELGQNLAKNPYDIASLLHVGWASGFGTVGDSSSLDNEKYPGWNPTPVIDYL